MPIHAHRHVRPSVQPEPCRPSTPDASGSRSDPKPGQWCDGQERLWEKYSANGDTDVEREQNYEVENVLHAVIEQAEQMGSLNPRLAETLNELGMLNAKQHKYAQAEQLFQRSLGVTVAALGPDHPDVAVSLKNIGILKASQKEYVEADLLLKQSLLLTTRTLGQEHPIVAVTMRTIAVCQAIQGHYEEAERVIRQSLAIGEKTLGSEHPEVAAGLRVFAQVLRVLRAMDRHTETATETM